VAEFIDVEESNNEFHSSNNESNNELHSSNNSLSYAYIIHYG